MKKVIATVGVLLLTMTPAMFAADAPLVSHSAISCIPANQHAKIVAKVTGATSARVYFRAAQATEEYFVEMLQDASGNWWAPLPIADDATTTVTYRIVAKGAGGDVSSPAYNVPVTANCASTEWTPEQATTAQAMVVGFVQDGKEIKGFRCKDVANEITPSGEMKRYDGCGPVLQPGQLTNRQNAAIAAGLTAISFGLASALSDDDVKPVSRVRPGRP